MTQTQTLKSLFKRYRRPGDIVFAWVVLAVSVLLLSQLWDQTAWRANQKLAAQPRFWPAVSLTGMSVFAALHLLSSALSERIAGRWGEVWIWVKSLEFAGWFIAYAAVLPIIGYLPSTIIFAVGLTWRAGYRSARMMFSATLCAIVIVLIFKTFLQVKLPAGQIYDGLPDGLRQIMLTYF